MDVKYNNSINTNMLTNNSKDITTVNNKQTIKQNSTNTSTNAASKTDSIEINEKDASKINKKKASDAFKESLSELDDDAALKTSAHFFVVGYMMQKSGIEVPSFNINDDTTSTGFLPFVNEMKNFVTKENITDKNGITIDETSFLDFCDMFKEKLTQYGCE